MWNVMPGYRADSAKFSSFREGNFSRIGDRVRLLQRYGGKPAQRRTHSSLRNNLKSRSTRDK